MWEAAPLLCSLVPMVLLGKTVLSFAPHGKRYSSSYLGLYGEEKILGLAYLVFSVVL